jgi:hypothetical protein
VRQIRGLTDWAFLRLDEEFDKLYAEIGRPSIAPERLLRSTLLMVLYSIRSERHLIERDFGWSKLDRQTRQVKLRGLDRVDWFWKLSITAHNLTRMRRLIPIESLAQQGRSVSGGRKSGLQTQNNNRNPWP